MSDPLRESPVRFDDIAAAFSLLTRLPVPVDHAIAGKRAAKAAWAYPLVGAVLGAFAGALGTLALWLGAPLGIAAALALAALVVLTGALHEDGLADCADGLGGGKDQKQRLSIMKDSRIGAYGATALALALLARWSGIESLAQYGLILPLCAVAAASRLPMVLVMTWMRPARINGLSAGVGAPGLLTAVLATLLALAICQLALGLAGLWLVLAAIAAPAPLLWLARRLIGGQTGDVLGGSQQLAEIAALAVAASLFT